MARNMASKKEKDKPINQNDGKFKPGNNANPDGRPIELTKAVQNTIVSYLEAGHFFSDACILSDVKPDTARHWMIKGGKGERPYDEFRDAVHKADASFKGVALAKIMAAIESDAKNYPAMFKLMALKFPKEWREKKDVELTGKDSGPIAITLTEIDSALDAALTVAEEDADPDHDSAGES